MKSEVCEFCEYKAKTFFTLQVHVQMNHMRVGYQCKICEYKLKEKYSAKKHIGTVHDIKLDDIDEYFLILCGICQFISNEKEYTRISGQNL